MSRQVILRFAVPALVLLGVLLARLLLVGGGSANEVPVYEVTRGLFVHKVTAQGTLKAKETTQINVPVTVRRRVRLAWVAPEGTLLEEGDLVARFDGSDFEVNLEEAAADLSGTTQDVVRTRAESDVKIGEHQRDYEVAELELDFAERFELTDEFAYSRHEIVEDAIDEELATARRDHAGDMSRIQEDLAQTELEILDIEKRKSALKIDEATTGLSSLEVRAPHRGLLTLSRNWRGETVSVGSEMWRGQEIGEIPALDAMEAEVFVLEADAGGVGEGQTATVVVENNPEVVHRAKVARVEAVAKPRFRGSPVQYFGVTLDFEATDTDTMKPGQRLVATLYLEELEEVIVVPRQAVFRDGDSFWVYRRDGSVFDAAPVEVGPGSAALLVIEGGLEPGQVIALTRPLDVDDVPSFARQQEEPAGGGR
ncbi:MAG: efflux RND transporter periplasmic adaptor subunit [Thermoanaerobaculia bacterium]